MLRYFIVAGLVGSIGCAATCHFWRGADAPYLTQKESQQENSWRQTTEFGFRVWVALNSTKGKGDPELRFVFLLLEDKYFNEADLRKLFSNVATKYPEPHLLEVTAYSDKAMLERAIENYLHYIPGLPLENKTGYFRAKYLRHSRNEKFYYSPDPYSEEYIAVTVTVKPVEYTGDNEADLLIAAEEGDQAKVKALLGQGLNVKARGRDGNTALMLASLGRLTGIAQLLLQSGADPNEKRDDGTTALQFCGSNGDADTARVLIANGANVDAKDKNGESALGLAAYNNHRSVVALLLESGADANTHDGEGNTPLMNAAMNGYADLVQLLLAKGAAVNARNHNGQTTLMLAHNEIQTLRLLISSGALVNAQDNNGRTALMFAAKNGQLVKVKALLAARADVDTRSNKGETALSAARESPDNNEVIELLKRAKGKL